MFGVQVLIWFYVVVVDGGDVFVVMNYVIDYEKGLFFVLLYQVFDIFVEDVQCDQLYGVEDSNGDYGV